MIVTELWNQKTATEAPNEVVNLFRQWENKTLNDEQFKMLMNKALGAKPVKPRLRSKTVKKWAEELAIAREMLGQAQVQINEQSKSGNLPDSRMMSDFEDLRSGVLACMDAVGQYGKPPTFIDTLRLQRLAEKVLGRFFPGQPLPNVEAPGTP